MDQLPTPSEATALAEPGPAGGLLRRNPDFAKLYAAALVSYAGDWFATVALLGLVLSVTGRPALAGLMMATSTLPYAIVSPFAGVVADRVDRKTLMIAADVARAGVALGFLAARSAETVWIAFLCQGVLSAVSPFFEPASSAAMPNLVRKEDLASANVLMGSAWGTMLAVGAALGGVVASTLGRDAAFLADAASFAISAALIGSIRGRFREKPRESAHVTIAEDVRVAVRFARREARVLALLVVKGGFGLAGGTIALLSIFAVKVFGRGETGIGILMGARGLGALIGPFLFRRWILRGRDERLLVTIGVAFTVYAVAYALFSGAPNIWLAALAVCGAHIGGGANWTISAYGLQRFTPDEVRGRVFSFDYALITLSMAASFSLAGFASGHVSPRAVGLGISVCGLVFAATWTAWATRLVARRPAAERASAA
jgi:MFS family permease